jgi:hypothetical protein
MSNTLTVEKTNVNVKLTAIITGLVVLVGSATTAGITLWKASWYASEVMGELRSIRTAMTEFAEKSKANEAATMALSSRVSALEYKGSEPCRQRLDKVEKQSDDNADKIGKLEQDFRVHAAKLKQTSMSTTNLYHYPSGIGKGDDENAFTTN